jgi:16S rRNA (guanine527-N7)-methyltransferase
MDCPTTSTGFMKPPKQQNSPSQIIEIGSSELGLTLPDSALAKMIKHIHLLLEWGKRINLTALKDPCDIAALHFLDSLTVLKVLPPGPSRIIDIGTGGGFPGMVLAEALPERQITLLDRDPKKIVFLKHLAKEISLESVRFLNMRLERLATGDQIDRFDLAMSRAFASDAAILDSFARILTSEGFLVRMTGPLTLPEEAPLQNFVEEDRWAGTLPFTNHYRQVILYRVKKAQ